MEEHFNVAFPSSPPTSDYTIDFFSPPQPLPFPPAAPVIAVITIYLGSLFHYSGAAEKTRGKVLCFMIYGGYLTCVY